MSKLPCASPHCHRTDTDRQADRDGLQVDVWALGISAVEMAEVTPPRWSVHPMRVIFMISRDPPPRLADRDRWSLTFHDFVAQCLQKVNPLTHPPPPPPALAQSPTRVTLHVPIMQPWLYFMANL